MRKILFASNLFLLGFVSCIKTEDALPAYRVSGLQDLTVNRNPFDNNPDTEPFRFDFAIKSLKESNKDVTLHVEGLPAGLTDSFSLKAGTPDFSTALFLRDRETPAGEYAPVLVIQAPGSTVSCPFRVSLTGFGSCAGYFDNRQLQTALIPTNQGPRTSFKSSTLRQTENSDTVLIKNFKNTGEDLKVVFNCATYKLEIPFQFTNTGFIQGYNGYIGILGTGNNNMPSGFSFGVTEIINNVQSYYSLYYTFE